MWCQVYAGANSPVEYQGDNGPFSDLVPVLWDVFEPLMVMLKVFGRWLTEERFFVFVQRHFNETGSDSTCFELGD